MLTVSAYEKLICLWENDGDTSDSTRRDSQNKLLTYPIMQRQQISNGPLSGFVIILHSQSLLHIGTQPLKVAAGSTCVISGCKEG